MYIYVYIYVYMYIYIMNTYKYMYVCVYIYRTPRRCPPHIPSMHWLQHRLMRCQNVNVFEGCLFRFAII